MPCKCVNALIYKPCPETNWPPVIRIFCWLLSQAACNLVPDYKLRTKRNATVDGKSQHAMPHDPDYLTDNHTHATTM